MVIRRHAVSMRTSDYRLNATQICNAAGLHRNRLRPYLENLKSHCNVTITKDKGLPKQSWVPFTDGVYLSQALSLFDELKPLFSQASFDVPGKEENYLLRDQCTKAKPSSGYELPDGYKALQRDGTSIIYMPSTRKVHAVQLLKLGNIRHPSAQLAYFLSRNQQIVKEVQVGHRRTQGTYVDYEDARLLCQHFNLSGDPIDEIVRRERAMNTLGDQESTSHMHYYDDSFDLGVMDGGIRQPISGKVHPMEVVSQSAQGAVDFPFYDKFQDQVQNAEPVLDTDHYSQFTERSCAYGSFLAPANQSNLQLANDIPQFTERNNEYGAFLEPANQSYLQLANDDVDRAA